MGRRRSFQSTRIVGSGLRRSTSWEPGPRGASTLATAGSSVFGTGRIAIAAGLTIVRVRGELLVTLTGAAAVTSGFSFAAGLAIVSENAAGVGVTGVPAPFTDLTWDGWLWHTQGRVDNLDVAGVPDVLNVARIVIDNKAMRKFKETDVLLGMFEVHNETGASSVRANLESRLLVKLP